MLRHIISRPIIPVCSRVSLRSFSAAAPVMAAGDTGAPKARGSLAGKDQFTRREEASENYYVRKHEQEKMEALKAKMKETDKHMKELQDHIEEITKDQGGEKN